MNIPRLVSVRVQPRKGPPFYGMQLTAYIGKFEDGSEMLISNSAYRLDCIIQVASKRAKEGYKFVFARRGYAFELAERERKNVIAMVKLSNDFKYTTDIQPMRFREV